MDLKIKVCGFNPRQCQKGKSHRKGRQKPGVKKNTDTAQAEMLANMAKTINEDRKAAEQVEVPVPIPRRGSSEGRAEEDAGADLKTNFEGTKAIRRMPPKKTTQPF